MKKVIQDQISEKNPFSLTEARPPKVLFWNMVFFQNAHPLLQRNFSKYFQCRFSQPKTEDLAQQDEDVKCERVFIL